MVRLGPLQINPLTREPFLQLRKHANIIITPPRTSDVPLIVSPMNDEQVLTWLRTPQRPYTEDHARQFLKVVKPVCDQGLKELMDANETTPIILSNSPIRVLRKVQEDGSDIFLGDIWLGRCPDIEYLMQDPTVDNATNVSVPPGHPDIVWTIGNYLVPCHHGQGIMSDTLINELGRPYLGVRHIVVGTLFNNEASKKVFSKNGFVLVES